MKIVQIEEIFHPKAGYQPNVLSKYWARDGHEVVIVSCEYSKMTSKFTSFFGVENIEAQDKEYENKYGVKIVRAPVYGHFDRRNFYKFGIVKYVKTLRMIKRMKPDILFVHGNEQVISMLAFIMYKYMNIPYITDSHMVAMAMEGKPRTLFYKIYRRIITPIIIKNKITNIRTQDENFVEKYYGIPLSQCPWISVGSDIMLFHRDIQVRNSFRNELNILESEFVVIYAGKLDWEKGGQLLADAFKEKFDNRQIVLIVVGNTKDDEYGQKVDDTLSMSENRILRFPTQDYEELAKFYQIADLAVFPRQCSLSFYDVQACGVPIVSEDNNINVDRLKFGNGLYFKSNDINDFREKVMSIVNMPKTEYSRMSENAERYVMDSYSYDIIAKQYIEEMKNSIKRFNKGEL